jgi:4-amino-4-deoxy-L-arabinose transferase-like glycosyltransferase
MRQQVRHQIWILLAGGIVCFTHLGGTRLWDKDETIYASCAREMFANQDWVVPLFNGHLFPDKPPLMYWLMISGFHAFGVTEFAARFWSAVLGVATALATYHLGRLLFRAEVGFWAALIVLSNLLFAVSARAATVDSALTLTATLAMLLFVIGTGVSRWRGADEGCWLSDGGSRASQRVTPLRILGVGFRCTWPFAPRTSAFSRSEKPRTCQPCRVKMINGVSQRGSWPVFALLYAVLGVAVLAKGPIGLLLPGATLGLFMLIVGRPAPTSEGGPLQRSPTVWLMAVWRTLSPGNLCRATWRLRPITAIFMVLAVAAPWFVLVGIRTEGAWLEQFFIDQNLKRAVATFDHHSGPFYYYILAVLIGFFPWSVFLGPTLIHTTQRFRHGDPRRAGYLLAICWLAVYLVFWSLVQTKLPHYILPAFPALALLTAALLYRWLENPESIRRGWLLNATVTWIVVGLAMLVVVPLVATVVLPGEGVLGLVGLVLVVGGLFCLACGVRGRTDYLLRGFVVTSIVFVTAIMGFAARRVDQYQNAPALLAEIRRSGPGQADLAAYRFFRESFVFYSGEHVPRCDGPEQLQTFLNRAERPFVVTTDEYEGELERAFPGQFEVVARRPRFLKRGTIVLLTRHEDPSPLAARRLESQRAEPGAEPAKRTL